MATDYLLGLQEARVSLCRVGSRPPQMPEREAGGDQVKDYFAAHLVGLGGSYAYIKTEDKETFKEVLEHASRFFEWQEEEIVVKTAKDKNVEKDLDEIERNRLKHQGSTGKYKKTDVEGTRRK